MEGVSVPSLDLENNKKSSIPKNRSGFSIKKTEHSREYKRLKLQEEFLDKSLTMTIQNLKIDADSVRQISEDRLKAFHQRQPEVQKSAESVLHMVRELKTLKSMLQEASDPLAIQNLDVNECRLRLTRLSSHIESFKLEKSVLESLIVEGDRLDSDLRDFERLVFTERSVSKSTSKFPYNRSSSLESANDEFTELVARTGHTKGWSSEDHAIFLRVRKKLDSVPQLVVELRRKFPHLSNEEIVNHEAWYKLYIELRDKRKRQITEWKSKRVPSVEVMAPEDGARTRLDDRKKKEAEDKKIEKKRMIEHWKAEKARKSAMDDEQRKELERARTEREKRRVKNSRGQVMARLREIREDRVRKIMEAQPILKKDQTVKFRDSMPKLMKAFREQDERFVRKRLSLLKMQDSEKEESKKSVIKPREYSTLFKATKSWKKKCEVEDDPEDSIFGRVNYVKDIQKLSSAGLRKADSIVI